MTDWPYKPVPGSAWISILKTSLNMFRTSPAMPWLWARETWGRRVVDRELEPETVMDYETSLRAAFRWEKLAPWWNGNCRRRGCDRRRGGW